MSNANNNRHSSLYSYWASIGFLSILYGANNTGLVKMPSPCLAAYKLVGLTKLQTYIQMLSQNLVCYKSKYNAKSD